ncbi:MAG: helix-turn-helix transcriptional regulator [Patescibacteria group bacterium]
MTRKTLPSPVSDDDNYVTLVTGGPTKYYNRRRVRKVFAQLERSPQFQPIDSEWFKILIRDTVSARHYRKMTQLTLAGILGTNQAAISRLESGKSNPTAELLDRIWSTLGVSPTFILKDND